MTDKKFEAVMDDGLAATISRDAKYSGTLGCG